MKLYVGTYAKYNAGSLAGAWLDLADYPSAEAFEAACRRLHKDEADPELMFQDCETTEDWEQGLYSESAVPRDWWRRKAEADAEAKAEAAKPKSAAAGREKAEQERLFEKFKRDSGYGNSPKMLAYFRKKYHFCELPGGEVYHIAKPSIETRFCCGEDDRGQGGDGPGTLAYAEQVNAEKRTHDGFLAANLQEIDREIEFWETRRWQERGAFLRTAYMGAPDAGVLSRDYIPEWWRLTPEAFEKPEGYRPITDGDAKAIAEAYRTVRAQFVKRLETWWKRYGADHITTWTYWTEA